MGELMIRRNRSFAVPQYQGVSKGEKTAGSSGSEKVSGGTGFDVSKTLQELMSRVGQAESRTRESRKTLQKGETVLDEVQDRLGRIAQLIQESAEGKNPDRAALQAELEQLVKDIDRMLSDAVADGVPLFLDGEADLGNEMMYAVTGGMPPGDVPEVPDWVNQLLEKIDKGMSPDQAIEELTGGEFTSLEDFLTQSADELSPELKQFLMNLLLNGGSLQLPAGSPLMSLLAGLEGMDLELLMGLLTASSGSQTVPEPAEMAEMAGMEGAVRSEGAARPDSVQTFGPFRVSGPNLSGVSFHRAAGELTVSGTADVTIRGAEQSVRGAEQKSIRITGSGAVKLENVSASALTVDTDTARILTGGGKSALAQVLLRARASLTVDGGGLLKIGLLRGDHSNTLRLAGGAVTVEQGEDGTSGTLTVPVVLEGAASLAVRAAAVSGGDGQAMEPFDLVWKTLLPNWSSITSVEVDGRQAKMALMNGDPARLWLTKGEHGYPIHGLIVKGKDASGRPRTRYAYLRWDRRTGKFREVSLYPNPFAVTGGEQGLDWVYEEESHTLRILSGQVTALSGGAGTDTNQEPFSGRIALEDNIGRVELALEGVVCRVDEGRAFDLGRGNDVVLLLQSGASNLFESGAGCAGISLGEDTTLCIECVKPEGGGTPDGILTATGGAGSAGIGWDRGKKQSGHILIRGGAGIGGGKHGFMGSVTIVGGMVTSTGGKGGDVNMGISLQAGEDSMTLPQFRLSARTLKLDRMNILTRHYARAAQAVVSEDRRWVAQVQTAYGALYSQLEQSCGALPNVCRYLGEKQRLLRDTDSASGLLEDMRRSILLQPSQAMRSHNRKGTENMGRLLR